MDWDGEVEEALRDDPSWAMTLSERWPTAPPLPRDQCAANAMLPLDDSRLTKRTPFRGDRAHVMIDGWLVVMES